MPSRRLFSALASLRALQHQARPAIHQVRRPAGAPALAVVRAMPRRAAPKGTTARLACECASSSTHVRMYERVRFLAYAYHRS